MLNVALQEKHPAKLKIDWLDQALEATLLRAFNRDIIHLNEQQKKTLESLKPGYYFNLELSYLIHCSIE